MKRALAAGLLVLVIAVGGATVWFVASTMADGVTIVRSYDERCSQPSDVVFPDGSCAPALRADDFAARRATLRLTISRNEAGTQRIEYSYENNTRRPRSLDWSLVEITTPTGARISCPGDDSMQHYPAPPSASRDSGYACTEIDGPGRYTASYGGVDVAHLDVSE